MSLVDRILDAIREQLGQPPRRGDRTYGEPSKRLTDLDRDHEVAGLDIADELDAVFPSAFNARLRLGSRFDPNRDYDGERTRAAHAISAELMRTWVAGKPYSSWVSAAARHAGL